MQNDLTLITCSYETPRIFEAMLKSFVFHHTTKHKLLISENSRDEKTVEFLNQNNLKFFKNPGFTHSQGVDFLLERVQTKYALLLDSDILFLKNIEPLYKIFIQNNLTLMGELQESRGGYNLYSRISPICCFINVENIKKFGIKFYDEERIKATNSYGFFKNVPLQNNHGGKMYDVGSTFYEDVLKNNLKVGKINQKIVEYIYHAEGCSWRTKSGIKDYVTWGNQVEKEFIEKSKMFQDIELKNKFVFGNLMDIEKSNNLSDFINKMRKNESV